MSAWPNRNESSGFCLRCHCRIDLIQIGNNWFSENDTVPEEYLDLLWSLWEDDITDENVLKHLLPYVIVPAKGTTQRGRYLSGGWIQ
ncbi:hypothetical protein BDV41DRAFT_539371 [Aspergillus transmontanensis]|uniref:Uncharacterized protein n=1 Tax=Aspergillus transmontanensis TaxID=1034304 RepID=A0A5N6VXF0_9EURO|nr:hypothetical protein BDV41DRAFT_539371 [Aspergillus transmontanensis]